jgi:hypothetical protein
MKNYWFIATFFLIFSFIIQPAHAWLSGWQYRKNITINNTQNSNILTNYQVLVDLDTQSLISEGKMQPYCNDTRFTDSDGDTLLSYWIESGCNTTSTKIWVNVTNIPASSIKTIYVYYGNPSASSASNATNTFDIYANFQDGTFQGWVDAEKNTGSPGCSADYPDATVDTTTGNPAPSAKKGPEQGSGYNCEVGIAKTINLPGNVNISIKVDNRAYSTYTTGSSPVTNANMNVYEGTTITGTKLWGQNLFSGRGDSGWISYGPYVANVSGYTTITIHLFTTDLWTTDWDKTVWFDNVIVRKYISPEPTTSVGEEEINQPPTLSYVWESPTDPATYSPGATYHFNITACDINGAVDISAVLFEWNGGANITVTNYVAHNTTCRNYTTTKTDLAAGTYNYKWYVNDTQNTWASLSDSYTVNQSTNPIDIYLTNSTGTYKNQNITVIFGQQTTVNVTAIYPNSGTVALYEDGNLVSNPRTTVLSWGEHSYKGNISGNANYTANATGATYYINVIDITPPTYSLNSTNSTLAGAAVSHNLYWQDDVGLSYAIFSLDNCTGSLQNITGMSLSGASAWSNFTVVINSTIGCTIRWCVYANDTSNNWNSSCSNPFIYVAKGLNCEAGGPYSLGSKILVAGNVFGETSNETNITINITKSGSLIASQTTTSDSSGIYYSIFNQYLDAGKYTVSVFANTSSSEFFCSDEFEVVSAEARKECLQKTISIKGKAIDISGNPINSGKAFISAEGITTTNSTNFSNGEFQAFLTACFYPGERYLVQLTIIDDKGKKGTKYFYYLAT